MIPDLIRKSLAGLNPMPIYGSGEQTRTFTHLDDVADGVVCAMGADAGEGEAFNIAWREETSIAELARLCWEACGRDPATLEARDRALAQGGRPGAALRVGREGARAAGVGGEGERRGGRGADG